MADLSKKQKAVRDFIASELAAGRSCPTHREIASHFGFASSYAAPATLTRLSLLEGNFCFFLGQICQIIGVFEGFPKKVVWCRPNHFHRRG
jgi:hypothetical protein